MTMYERDAESVLVFFTRRTLDVEVALDLTAETFAQAWRGWPQVRGETPGEMGGWLFTIARPARYGRQARTIVWRSAQGQVVRRITEYAHGRAFCAANPGACAAPSGFSSASESSAAAPQR